MKEGKTPYDPPWPVLVRIENGPSVVVLMNAKAYRKSREQMTPWLSHPATGRVLPWPGKPVFLSIRKGNACFELSLPAGSDPYPYGKTPPEDIDPDHREDSEDENPSDFDSPMMAKLSRKIKERRQNKPSGSYTTHLFQEGAEKIRKKMGEEAIELLLAQNKKDIIYESADLLYHWLVLLEVSELHWSDVEAEIDRRYHQ